MARHLPRPGRAPAGRRAPLGEGLLPPRLIVGIAALAVALGGCREDPASKVVDWPTRWPEPVPDVVEAEAEDVAAPAPVEPELPEAPTGCAALIDAACEALGRHSEECLEARSALPRQRPPEFELACAEVLERYLGEEPADDVRGVNPCRLMERRKCAALGPRTVACKLAREDARRLRYRRMTGVGLGDLLQWEARRIFSGRVSGTGR